MDRLTEAVARIEGGSSLYWASYRPEVGADPQEVEVRLDLPPATARTFAPPGWRVCERHADGTVFLRRSQAMGRSEVAAMLVEALRLAAANAGTFHSWLHGDDLT